MIRCTLSYYHFERITLIYLARHPTHTTDAFKRHPLQHERWKEPGLSIEITLIQYSELMPFYTAIRYFRPIYFIHLPFRGNWCRLAFLGILLIMTPTCL